MVFESAHQSIVEPCGDTPITYMFIKLYLVLSRRCSRVDGYLAGLLQAACHFKSPDFQRPCMSGKFENTDRLVDEGDFHFSSGLAAAPGLTRLSEGRSKSGLHL